MTQPAPSGPPPAQFPQMSPPPIPQQLDPAMMTASLRRRVSRGANNFYFIAVLSLANSIISALGFSLTFIFGLSLSQIVDGMASAVGENYPSLALIGTLAGLVVSILISGFFALLGFFAGRGKKWAFLIGMILYVLDGILLLGILLFVQSGGLGDWFALALHAYFLWNLWMGFQAVNQLQKWTTPRSPIGTTSDFPKDIGIS